MKVLQESRYKGILGPVDMCRRRGRGQRDATHVQIQIARGRAAAKGEALWIDLVNGHVFLDVAQAHPRGGQIMTALLGGDRSREGIPTGYLLLMFLFTEPGRT